MGHNHVSYAYKLILALTACYLLHYLQYHFSTSDFAERNCVISNHFELHPPALFFIAFLRISLYVFLGISNRLFPVKFNISRYGWRIVFVIP